MAYPTTGILLGAKMSYASDRQMDRASNGTVRARTFYTTAKRSFDLSHYLSASEHATFDAFYLANLAASFAFVWPADGVSYTCIFATDPSYEPQPGSYTKVAVQLVQV